MSINVGPGQFLAGVLLVAVILLFAAGHLTLLPTLLLGGLALARCLP